MEISHLGHSSFKIVGKEITLITDPFDANVVGIPFPKAEADVVTVSHHHADHGNVGGVKGNFICFDSPGEYEIKNSEITAVPSYHDEKNGAERGENVIFIYEVDGIHLCHLGDLGTDLNAEQIEKIDGVDILFIPVGGGPTIDNKKAAKVISDIEPKIIVPMHYRVGKLTTLGTLDDFIKELGKTPKKTDKLKIQKKDLPEEMELVVIE